MPALLMSLILSVCLVGSEGEPTPAATREPVTMEVDISTGHIILPVYIEEHGPYWFILDTGNQNTAIYSHIAESAGIETKPYGEVGGAGSGSFSVRQAADIEVRLGSDKHPLVFTDPLVTVLPDDARLPDLNGKRIDGFLGASLIEQYMTSIDYGSGELLFTERESYKMPDEARVMEIKIAMGFPYFEGEVIPMLMGKKTKPVVGNFLLDLGATYAIDIKFEKADALGLIDADDPDQQLAGQGMGIDGVMFDLRTAPLAHAKLGGLQLDEPRVLFMTTPGGGPEIENLVGNVGSGLFQSDRVTLDYLGGRLIWEDR
ncbi:MAG: clan AA aspartic protease [Phycisphaerales bacterium]|nr:clan AA aspartic protease [Phycisphaerales bacterium]